MAVTSIETHSTPLYARIGASIWSALMHIAENSSQYKAVEKINALSDADIEAMGTTRVDLVREAFGVRANI